ncbi:hypothetical protein [Fusobacterium sp. PH5-44]|uniref:hypothetical protein n=1 Tax=unclassified Fusobacterium TaxID=2648384 RepID=UPI003D1FC315
MKFRIWIGNENENATGINDIITSGIGSASNLVQTKNSLHLSEYEVISVDLLGCKISDTYDKASNMSAVHKESTFEVRVKCKVRSMIDKGTTLGIFTKGGKSIGKLPSKLSDYNSYRETVENLYKQNQGANTIQIVSVLGNIGDNNYREVDLRKSCENCINIKKWYLMYKESLLNKIKNGTVGDEVYRNVKIEAVLSDMQSFYYEFKNMYVDQYDEHLSTEEGASEYSFLLKEKYVVDKSEMKISLIEKAGLTDKVGKGFKSISDSFSNVFGSNIDKKNN